MSVTLISNKRRRTDNGAEQVMDSESAAVIADLQQKLAAALEERDNRTRQVENWQEYALGLHKEVIAQKVTIEEQNKKIERLQKENLVHKELREELSEKVAELEEDHIAHSAPEDQAAEEEQEILELQVNEVTSTTEEKCVHAIVLEDVQAELEICKERLASQEMYDAENIISVCMYAEELSLKVLREEHEEEKKELIVEIKARKMALEMLGDKLKEVAEQDEYFKKKLEAINYDL